MVERIRDGTATVVARHWEQSVWGGFSLERLTAAADDMDRYHPLARPTAAEADRRTPPFPTPAVAPIRVTDAAHLDDVTRRKMLASECGRLCLDEEGELARPWQIHILRTGEESAVITAGFARRYFDRISIRRFLEEILERYHSGIRTPVTTLRPFHDLALVRPEDGRQVPAPLEDAADADPDLPVRQGHEQARAGPFDRVSVRLDVSSWAAVCGNLAAVAPDVSREALLAAASRCAIDLWSQRPDYRLCVSRDSRTRLGIPRDVPGQFELIQIVAGDRSRERSFGDEVHAWQRSLDDPNPAELDDTSAARPSTVILSHSTVSSVETGRRLRGDEFVFVGSSRPGIALEIHADETTEGGLTLHFDHDSGRFQPGVIDDLSAGLESLLRRLATGADAWRLDTLGRAWTMLPKGQRTRRVETNDTQRPLVNDLLHTGFIRRFDSAPERPAVIASGRSLTYADLFGHACAVARQLQEREVRTNELVAVAMRKGWEQVAAVLGVSMAGAVYLPLDLELPEARKRFLIEHGDVRWILTTSHDRDKVPPVAGAVAIDVDLLAPAPAGTRPPSITTKADHLAYVIFTSGSTGSPKGVMITHRGAVNTIVDMNRRFEVSPDDRVLALSRLSFDLSVYDIFGLLAAGGAIIVPEPALAQDPSHWLDLAHKHRVTIWNTVPALMQLFVDSVSDTTAAPPRSLRHVWMSGDWIPLSLPERIREFWPSALPTSLGGATEASIWSICHRIDQVDPSWRSIPYGRPMANQSFHVLHENLTHCPDHVPGELFIGGVGLAQGYWKDPVRTNERFIRHPSLGRLYRTGDLGRFLPDGSIEFLGRSDFQVKIRGFRIELGEIEAALNSHGKVRAAVVVAHGGNDSDRRLVAHVVPENGVHLSVDDLKDHMHERLPEYMVPPTIMFTTHLPLTANGKVDLRALPAPGPADGQSADRGSGGAPTNELEELLLNLWRSLLGMTSIGIDDDFFALGGTSLTGTRLIMRLRTAFDLQIPVQILAEHRTIRELGRSIEALLLEDIA